MPAPHAATSVLSTHCLFEDISLAERLVVVDHGNIIADDTAARLKADLGGDRVILGFATAEIAGVAAEQVGIAHPAADVRRVDEHVEVRVTGGTELLPRLIGEIGRASCR